MAEEKNLIKEAPSRNCPKCGAAMLLFTSLNMKACVDCFAEYDWFLKPKQKPLIQYQR